MAKNIKFGGKAFRGSLAPYLGYRRVLHGRCAEPESSRVCRGTCYALRSSETDDYNVHAFNEPITSTKARPIYNMHIYWSRNHMTPFDQYIRHFTPEGGLVLDCFCGSGGTALAAC